MKLTKKEKYKLTLNSKELNMICKSLQSRLDHLQPDCLAYRETYDFLNKLKVN